ncbi:MAG: hypothetical protein OJF60_000397 [Burkholderiaceae bacterium]|jgi:hypothetical protein|nr:MAG: hypothetical protein OJF60_000397 [Burkholderiaceae bacterium]
MKFLRYWLATGALCLATIASAAPQLGLGPLDYTIPRERLQQALEQRFPYREGLSDLLALRLSDPRLSLLPKRNRIATALKVEVAGQLLESGYSGTLQLDYGLRFEPLDDTIRMTQVQVDSLSVDGIPAAFQPAVQQYAPQVAEQLLDDFPLHRLSSNEVALADRFGYTLGSFKVVPQGLEVTLVSKPASAPSSAPASTPAAAPPTAAATEPRESRRP